jgi:ferritin
MTLSQTLQDALNDQIKYELASAHLYLSMAAYCETLNLSGFAHWMRVQYQEEAAHAMKFFDFINDRGGRVIVHGIAQPPTDFESPLDVFQKALENEQAVSALINRLYDLATRENDYPTQVMLHWFIEEQVEEEKSATEIVELLKLTGGQGAALIMLDRQLAARRGED